MTNTVGKVSANNLVRLHTQHSREILAALNRAEEQYHAKIRRADAELGEAVRKIAAAMTVTAEQSAETPADTGVAAAE